MIWLHSYILYNVALKMINNLNVILKVEEKSTKFYSVLLIMLKSFDNTTDHVVTYNTVTK